MEYVIRTCRRDDLPVLVKLCAEHAAYEQAIFDATDKVSKLGSAIFAEQPRLFCLLAETQQEVVGFATYTFDFSTWDAQTFLYLDCLYLRESFRGAGIGEALMLKLQAIAVQHACVNIQWQTPHWNERAVRFYTRIGGQCKTKARFTLVV
jgi:ribosomal protein S18 acetylase RimI-like enzyme